MSTLLSCKTYRSGDIIMTSKPMVNVLTDQMKTLLCDYCLAVKSSLMSCSICCQMFYCNQICQQNDWSNHRLECDIFKENPDLKSSTKIMIRLWLMVINDKTLANKPFSLPSGLYISLNDIKPNDIVDEDIDSLLDKAEKENTSGDLTEISIKDMAVIQFKLLVEKFIECKLDPDLKLLWHLFTRVWSHVLPIDVVDSDMVSNAYGLFIEISSIRHSCEPNACYVSYGNHLQVRAIKRIKPNEEITISYIDLSQSKSERQQLLRSYYIECHCFKCQLNTDANIEYHKFQSLNREFSQLLNIDKNIDCEELLSIAEQLVPYYESIFPDYYPDLSLFLVKYLKLMFLNVIKNMGKNISKDYLEFVLSNVKITHGIDHKLYRKIPVVNDITLIDLVSDSDKLINRLKPKPKTNLLIRIFKILFALFILFLIYDNLI